MAKQVQCNRCGYIFDSEEEGFGYCPCCENDQVEIEDNIITKPSDLFRQSEEDKELMRLRFNNMLDYGKMMASMDIPKFLKIQEDNNSATYINLNDIIQIDEILDEDEYLFHTSRGTYHRVPINEGTSKVVEYLLNQLL